MSRRRLQQATSVSGHDHGAGAATYIDAHALLLTWSGADGQVSAEVAALQRRFSSRFNFDTEVRSISKPAHIVYSVSRFIRAKARPAHLLVVCYKGQGQSIPTDDLGRLQSLFETPGCDLLVLWDCEHKTPWTSPVVWDSGTATRDTIREVLASDISCRVQHVMPGNGDDEGHSLTASLTDLLSEAAASGQPASVRNLRSHLARRCRGNSDDLPRVVLGSPTHGNSPTSGRSIMLAPLPPRDEAQVILCLRLRNDSDAAEWARWIDSIEEEAPDSRDSISISGFRSAEPRALALVAVAISKWQLILDSPSPSAAFVGFEIIGGTDAIAHPMCNIIEDHLATRLEADSLYSKPYLSETAFEPSPATTADTRPIRSKRGHPELEEEVAAEGYSLRGQPKRTRKALPAGRKLLPSERSDVVSPISPGDDDAVVAAEHQRKALPSARAWRADDPLPITSPLSPGSQVLACPDCNSTGSGSGSGSSPNRIWFKDEESLAAHVRKMHTRPFQCIFCWVGCESKFASKNEWKRHVMSQHILLYFWVCQEGACAKIVNANIGVDGRFAHGSIFNRKDLYTQHLRRMHQSAAVKKLHKQAKVVGKQPAGAAVTEFNEWVHGMQIKGQIERCQLPDYMECPAEGCALDFSGPKAFDDRMEHVAKHLERAALGQEPPVVFGGDEDPTLTEWATQPQVGIAQRRRGAHGWLPDNPLKPGVVGLNGGGNGDGGEVSDNTG